MKIKPAGGNNEIYVKNVPGMQGSKNGKRDSSGFRDSVKSSSKPNDKRRKPIKDNASSVYSSKGEHRSIGKKNNSSFEISG